MTWWLGGAFGTNLSANIPLVSSWNCCVSSILTYQRTCKILGKESITYFLLMSIWVKGCFVTWLQQKKDCILHLPVGIIVRKSWFSFLKDYFLGLKMLLQMQSSQEPSRDRRILYSYALSYLIISLCFRT